MIDAVSNGASGASAQPRNMRVCSITLYDETIPGLTFDEAGVCNLARDGQWRLRNERLVSRAFEGRIPIPGLGEFECIVYRAQIVYRTSSGSR